MHAFYVDKVKVTRLRYTVRIGCLVTRYLADAISVVTDAVHQDHDATKLQTLVYDILLSTTAVFSYAIGSRKLSANEQLLFLVFCCCWCSNSSKFVTNN